MKKNSENNIMPQHETIQDQQAKQDQKKKRKGFLKAAFTGAVVTGALRYVAKSASGLSGLTGPAGVILATVATGVVLTAYDVFKDYRQARKTMPAKSAIKSLLSREKAKKYAVKMAFNTAGAAVGALAVVGLDTLFENEQFMGWAKNMTAKFMPNISVSLPSFLQKPDAPLTQTEPSTPTPVDNLEEIVTTATPITAPPISETTAGVMGFDPEIGPDIKPEIELDIEPPVLALSPLDQLSQSFSEMTNLGSEAEKTLALAQQGNMRAVKDLAMYVFNGVDSLPSSMQSGFEGIAQNKELGIALYEMAAENGYEPARADLDYIDARGWRPEILATESVEKMAETSPEILPEPTPETVWDATNPQQSLIDYWVGQDLTAQEQKLFDGLTAGQPWALESAGVGILNGTYDLPDNLPQGFAMSLLEQAADQGHEKAKIDLAYFQYHGLYGVSQNQAEALKTVTDLGKTWAGGEVLLPSSTVTATPDLTPETEIADLGPQPAASCDVGADQQGQRTVTCDVNKSEMAPGDYVEIKANGGRIFEFMLASDAAHQNTEKFVSERLPTAMQLLR